MNLFFNTILAFTGLYFKSTWYGLYSRSSISTFFHSKPL